MNSTPKRPAPPPPIQDPKLLRTFFDRVDTNGNGMISSDELKSALTNGFEDFPFQLSTVKSMMEIFGFDSQEIDFQQFGHIWKYINDWQKCFKSFDRNKSGSIDANELYNALTSFGYGISQAMAQLLVKRFDRTGKNEILFDDFIRCCLILHGLTKEFQNKDQEQIGKAEISYEEFLKMVLSCSCLFH